MSNAPVPDSRTPLRYSPAFEHQNMFLTAMEQFKHLGYCVIPGVFERDSVDAYLAECESMVIRQPNGRHKFPLDTPHSVAALFAPRIRQILPYALSPYAMAYQPAVHEVAWLIKDGEEAEDAGGGWHKDRGHEGLPGAEYQYPMDVHIGMYFRDMTVEDGPTAVIPGSHRDPNLNPWVGDAPVKPFTARKEDVVLWDQRCWHRAMPRRKPGLRILTLYGFYALPRFKDNLPGNMPGALRQAWETATVPLDQLYFGGLWYPRDVVGPERK